jgi:hypothetical protein
VTAQSKALEYRVCGFKFLRCALACPGFSVLRVNLEATSSNNLTKILRIFSTVSSEPQQGRVSNPFHLIFCSLFHDTLKISDYKLFDYWMLVKWICRIVEECGRGLLRGTIWPFSWWDWGKQWKPQSRLSVSWPRSNRALPEYNSEPCLLITLVR